MKVFNASNFRVEVQPRRRVYGILVLNPDEEKSACEGIATQIKRHVDDIGFVTVISDSEPVCSFCGSKWTEDDKTYNGGCCDEDEKNNPATDGGKE